MKIQHQKSLNLIQHQLNECVVLQRESDGYINATALCHAAGKRWNDYSATQSTKAFFTALAAKTGIPVLELNQVVRSTSGVASMWVHPKAALHLAQWLSADFAVQVTEWVYDWMSGKGVRTEPQALPYHLSRYLANDQRVPTGYFSVLQETALNLFGPLHNLGFEIPKGWVPDISVGRLFCKWLRNERGIDTDALPNYLHDYQDGRPPVEAKLYPDDLLADFRRWFKTVWLPENGVNYFKRKDPDSLVYLDRHPALTAPSSVKLLPGKKQRRVA